MDRFKALTQEAWDIALDEVQEDGESKEVAYRIWVRGCSAKGLDCIIPVIADAFGPKLYLGGMGTLLQKIDDYSRPEFIEKVSTKYLETITKFLLERLPLVPDTLNKLLLACVNIYSFNEDEKPYALTAEDALKKIESFGLSGAMKLLDKIIHLSDLGLVITSFFDSFKELKQTMKQIKEETELEEEKPDNPEQPTP